MTDLTYPDVSQKVKNYFWALAEEYAKDMNEEYAERAITDYFNGCMQTYLSMPNANL